jgi:serine/threonine protein kinase
MILINLHASADAALAAILRWATNRMARYVGSGMYGDIFCVGDDALKFAWYDSDADDPAAGPNVESALQTRAAALTPHVMRIEVTRVSTVELAAVLRTCPQHRHIYFVRRAGELHGRSYERYERLLHRGNIAQMQPYSDSDSDCSGDEQCELLLDRCTRLPQPLLQMRMRMADGGTLGQRLCQLSGADSLRILTQLLLGLAALQRGLPGFRHNDLHLGNVLLCSARTAIGITESTDLEYDVDGESFRVPIEPESLVPYIADFGLAVTADTPNRSVRRQDGALCTKPNHDARCDQYDMFVLCDEWRRALAHHFKRSPRSPLFQALLRVVRLAAPRGLRGRPSTSFPLRVQAAIRKKRCPLQCELSDGAVIPYQDLTPATLLRRCPELAAFRS